MATYDVQLTVRNHYRFQVEADSEEEAHDAAYQSYGPDDLVHETDFDITVTEHIPPPVVAAIVTGCGPDFGERICFSSLAAAERYRERFFARCPPEYTRRYADVITDHDEVVELCREARIVEED